MTDLTLDCLPEHLREPLRIAPSKPFAACRGWCPCQDWRAHGRWRRRSACPAHRYRGLPLQ